MALESATYISDLVVTNPTGSDPLAFADDHLRLVKSTLKTTFPAVTGAVTVSHTQINDLLQKSGGTMTGLLTLSAAPTADLHASTKKYVDDKDSTQKTYIDNAITSTITTVGTTADGRYVRYDTASQGLTSTQKTNALTNLGLNNGGLVPAGAVMHFAQSTAPTGWLICDGSTVSRTLYPALFAALGTTFGAPDASTFNLPDLRGVFVRGLDNGRGIDSGRSLGSYQEGTGVGDMVSSNLFPISTGIKNSDGSLGTSYTVSHQAGISLYGGSGTWSSVAQRTRPVNVSLLPCIKT